jgi:hypothetical protein
MLPRRLLVLPGQDSGPRLLGAVAAHQSPLSSSLPYDPYGVQVSTLGNRLVKGEASPYE